jgi:hypothetical protein
MPLPDLGFEWRRSELLVLVVGIALLAIGLLAA